MDWSDEGLKAAGIFGNESSGNKAVYSNAIVRYVSGCIHRERERVAKVLTAAGADPRLIQGILSEDDDASVFHWSGPAKAPARQG